MKNILVILLKELVIFPNQEIKIKLNNKLSKLTINEALLKHDGRVLVIAPLDNKEEEPGVEDLPKVGVCAFIKNKIALSDNSVRVTLRGIERVAVNKYFTLSNNEFLMSEVMNIDLPKYDENEENAVRRKLIEVVEEYINSSDNISNSIITTINKTKDLDKITDIVVSFLPFDVSRKLFYMQTINPLNRAKKLIGDIAEEIKYIKIDDELDDSIRSDLESVQKEYILKEKLKAIKKELGEESLKDEEVRKFRNTLDILKIDDGTKEKLNHEIDKYEVMNESSPEVSVLRNYLDWVINLPWNKRTREEHSSKYVKKRLDETHYGLKKIKERIIEYIMMKNINKELKSPIICLVGPPGVGKTSIAVSIAKSMNRKFYKIAVGGMNDSTELIGSRRTYLAANPGKIIQGIKKSNSKNPVILIDEVDKMVKDYKGDPASTLLEIIDPVQNKYFIDNYVEEPFDLSEVMFILTANNKYDIPEALLDRVELFELNSYTSCEKISIAKKYLLPRVYDEYKLEDNRFHITDDMLNYIINGYTKEAGVRELERVLKALIRKLVINDIKSITKDRVRKLLGNPSYFIDEYPLTDVLGVVNMLAVSNYGGIVTTVEVIKYKGSGNIIVTGSVEKIMQESISVVVSFIKEKYSHVLNVYDYHFHFLDAAVRKDGPSAGVSIATALLSLLEKKTVPKDIAFTGEISLNGIVLKVGGLKEKIIGAYNNGIKLIYIPKSNELDLEEVPKNILDNLSIKCVSNYSEIYNDLFK